MAAGNYRRAIWCENCGVVAVHPADRYCEACAVDIEQWIEAAEFEDDERYSEAFYISELEAKQLNFHLES